MKKVFITGCGGMLGEAIYNVFKPDYDLMATDINLNSPWLSRCDVRDEDEFWESVEAYQPDYLFHLAALTDLEYCEQHSAEAYATNSRATERAGCIANYLGIPIIYTSTAGIFDGKQSVYDDWSTPNPINHYGRSKYEGECYITSFSNSYLIVRAGWMMGGGPVKDKKFIQKLMTQIADGATELHIVDDKSGSPTYTYDFARNLKLLVESDCRGAYHMAGEGTATRLEVARELIHLLGREDIKLVAVSSDYFAKDYFAPRPRSEQLLNQRLKLEGYNQMRDWRLALSDYIQHSYKDQLVHAHSVHSS